jgi:hypothetical protein
MAQYEVQCGPDRGGFTVLLFSSFDKVRVPFQIRSLRKKMTENNKLRDDGQEPGVANDRTTLSCSVERFTGTEAQSAIDVLAVEEPLECQLAYGTSNDRHMKSISVTMRTPGHDFELAAGFLMTEGYHQRFYRCGADKLHCWPPGSRGSLGRTHSRWDRGVALYAGADYRSRGVGSRRVRQHGKPRA